MIMLIQCHSVSTLDCIWDFFLEGGGWGGGSHGCVTLCVCICITAMRILVNKSHNNGVITKDVLLLCT